MSRKTDTTIQFSGLKPGSYNFQYTLNDAFFNEFENDELKGAQVDFEVILERLEHTLMFTFQFTGEIKVLCDRCLGEMTMPVTGEEKLCVRFSDTEQSNDEDVAILPEGAFEIDLAQWMYEYVAVRIPIRHTHPEGECDPAMVGRLVDEDNASREEGDIIDPRWEALKVLKNK